MTSYNTNDKGLRLGVFLDDINKKRNLISKGNLDKEVTYFFDLCRRNCAREYFSVSCSKYTYYSHYFN